MVNIVIPGYHSKTLLITIYYLVKSSQTQSY